jgi:hypothetical protein
MCGIRQPTARAERNVVAGKTVCSTRYLTGRFETTVFSGRTTLQERGDEDHPFSPEIYFNFTGCEQNDDGDNKMDTTLTSPFPVLVPLHRHRLRSRRSSVVVLSHSTPLNSGEQAVR